MKVYQELLQDIQESKSVMEIIGYILAHQALAFIYCKQNCPEYVDIREDGRHDISIWGLEKYLDSESRVSTLKGYQRHEQCSFFEKVLDKLKKMWYNIGIKNI